MREHTFPERWRKESPWGMEENIFLGDGGEHLPGEMEESPLLGVGSRGCLGCRQGRLSSSAAPWWCPAHGSPVLGHIPGFRGAGKGILSREAQRKPPPPPPAEPCTCCSGPLPQHPQALAVGVFPLTSPNRESQTRHFPIFSYQLSLAVIPGEIPAPFQLCSCPTCSTSSRRTALWAQVSFGSHKPPGCP